MLRRMRGCFVGISLHFEGAFGDWMVGYWQMYTGMSRFMVGSFYECLGHKWAAATNVLFNELWEQRCSVALDRGFLRGKFN